ncbi:MAG: SDR family NAD(P)-dependent oxidoreductase [Acidimicrobiales bacterium]
MRLQGKVAIVTGGARGIGRGIAERFAEEGAAVVIGDLLEEEGARVAATVEGRSGRSKFLRTDVTIPSDLDALVALAESTYGKLDVVVPNAGIAIPGDIEQLGIDDCRRQFDVNFMGTWLTCKQALPALRRNGGGSIVITASAAATHPLPQSGLYGPTKAAIVLFMKNLALTAANDHIRCNAVAPGPIVTDLYHFRPDEEQSFVDRWTPELPAGFLGTPRDVANVALFLASDEARWVTGSVYAVDGGFNT